MRTYDAVPSAVTVPPWRPDPKPPITESSASGFSENISQIRTPRAAIDDAWWILETDEAAAALQRLSWPMSEIRVTLHPEWMPISLRSGHTCAVGGGTGA